MSKYILQFNTVLSHKKVKLPFRTKKQLLISKHRMLKQNKISMNNANYRYFKNIKVIKNG